MPQCLIALGSNCEPRALALLKAFGDLVETPGIRHARLSRCYASQPIGGPAGQATYVNAAAVFETELTPREVFQRLGEIERAAGRIRTVRWGPRTLDLDLLLYDQRQIDQEELTIPHPRMAARPFVLEPAAEIAPEWPHPTCGWPLSRLRDHLRDHPPYLALTGAPGAGKSSLAAAVASRFRVRQVLDHPAEAQLAAFYADPRGLAWDTELAFLASRQAWLASDTWPAHATTLSDFWFDQCLAFASVWLTAEELTRYLPLYQAARQTIQPPRLLVWLDPPPDVLATRVAGRGRPYERRLTPSQLHKLSQAITLLIEGSYSGPLVRLSGDLTAEEVLAETLAALTAWESAVLPVPWPVWPPAREELN